MPKILIADDEANIRLLLEQTVNGLGHEVILANDGQEAFRLATAEQPDLVLLDIMMPGWNGVDAIKSLEFIDKRPKVMVISGYISDDLQQELDGLDNVVDFVTKPFSLADVRKKIDSHLAGDAGAEA